MNAHLLAFSAAALFAVTSHSAAACDGPNCSQSGRNTFGSTGPGFGLTYDSAQSARPGSMGLDSGCGCNSCDPRIPCSPTTCARQGCQDCGGRCPTCPSSQFNGWSPANRNAPSPSYRSWSAPRSTLPVAQNVCPVTGQRLGSMGPPIPVTVMGQTVYVCCESCVNTLRRNPEQYLSSGTGTERRSPIPAASRSTWSRAPGF